MLPGHPALNSIAALLILLFLVWFALLFRLGKALRSRHPALWQRLGEPEWLKPGGRRAKGVLRFILLGQYREAADPTVDRIGAALRLVFAAFVPLLVAWAALAFRGR